jgi:hypothetical protein
MQLVDLGYLDDLETGTESPNIVGAGWGGSSGSISPLTPPTATVGVNAAAEGTKTKTNAQTTGYTYYDYRTGEWVAVAYGVGMSVARTPGPPPTSGRSAYPTYSPYQYPSSSQPLYYGYPRYC